MRSLWQSVALAGGTEGGREGSGDGGEKSQTQKTLATPEDL